MTLNDKKPFQTIIFWRGSKKDPLPDSSPSLQYDVMINNIVCSGHKETFKALNQLKQITAEFTDGVIIALVGRSNGLGPILAAHTIWPIIAVPTTLKEFPDDIWSSIRLPSKVPLLTTWPVENAILAAKNILAINNPALRQKRSQEIASLEE